MKRMERPEGRSVDVAAEQAGSMASTAAIARNPRRFCLERVIGFPRSPGELQE
jgi:hypothetical protein